MNCQNARESASILSPLADLRHTFSSRLFDLIFLNRIGESFDLYKSFFYTSEVVVFEPAVAIEVVVEVLIAY